MRQIHDLNLISLEHIFLTNFPTDYYETMNIGQKRFEIRFRFNLTLVMC